MRHTCLNVKDELEREAGQFVISADAPLQMKEKTCFVLSSFLEKEIEEKKINETKDE